MAWAVAVFSSFYSLVDVVKTETRLIIFSGGAQFTQFKRKRGTRWIDAGF